METAIFADDLHAPLGAKLAVAPAPDWSALLRYLAKLKNVPVTAEQTAIAIAWAAETWTAMQADSRPVSIQRVTDPANYVANRIIDIVATIEVMRHVITLIEGNSSASAEEVFERAKSSVDRFTGGVLYFRWPSPMETFLSHYRDVPWAPIVVKGDDGSVLTIYKCNDVLHRAPKEGPAFHRTSKLGECSEYWVDGKKHRPHEAGPAIVNSEFEISGTVHQEYYEQGVMHRPANEGPALLQTHQGRVIAEFYVEQGELHRDPAIGPAQSIETEVFQQRAYAVNGKFHRDPNEGPAWHRKDASRERTEYIVRGHLHRDPVKGPALIDTNFEDRGTRREEYFWEGQLHRPSSEGPAVIETDASGNRVLEIYVEHGLRHRDPKEGPAWHGIENGVDVWEYCVAGKLHREDGPAAAGRDPTTGVIICEKYFHHGELHHEHGPAVIARDRETGVLLSEEYFSRGQLHRDDGPAYIEHNPQSGVITYEEYCRDGQTHRDDGPAVIAYHLDGCRSIERWYRRNDYHRDPRAGPAVTLWNADGTIIEEFWSNNEHIETRYPAVPPNRRARRAAKSRKRKVSAKRTAREACHA